MKFDSDGVCIACRNYDARQNTPWEARADDLRDLCEEYMRDDGRYDVLIPVSGGKDSHTLVHVLKNQEHMHPLLFTVTDPFTKTDAGMDNIKNLVGHFGCDHMAFTLNEDLHRRLIIEDTENELHPLKTVEMLIYVLPSLFAGKLGIPLVFFGEDSAYLYGTSEVETPDATPTVRAIYDELRLKFWKGKNDPHPFANEVRRMVRHLSTDDALEGVDVQWMSYYMDWDDEKNYELAEKHGFRDLTGEWEREGWLEPYTQIDSCAYILQIWTKYPKYGFQRATDMASRWIRKGKITRDEGMRLVEENDHKLDPRAFDDFLWFLRKDEEWFWKCVKRHERSARCT